VIALGIDAGGTAARWLLLDSSGRELGGGQLPPFTGLLSTPNARTENLARFRAVLSAARELAPADAVVAGVTGLHAGTAAAALFRDAAAELGYGESVWIGNDMRIAYASVYPPGGGVLVYAGTGSVAFHVKRDGVAVSAGGHGMLIDDAGGGFWIGREGLKQTLRWHDELGRPSDLPLAQEVYASLGSTRWPDINQTVHEDGRGRIASLAPAVGRAALRSDTAATEILTRAGGELARLATAVFGQLGAVLPVALAGGVVAVGPMLTNAFAANLPAGVPWRVASLEPERAAAELALAKATNSQNTLSLCGS